MKSSKSIIVKRATFFGNKYWEQQFKSGSIGAEVVEALAKQHQIPANPVRNGFLEQAKTFVVMIRLHIIQLSPLLAVAKGINA